MSFRYMNTESSNPIGILHTVTSNNVNPDIIDELITVFIKNISFGNSILSG